MKSDFLLQKQPRLLVLVLLGLVISAPIVMTVVLFIFSLSIFETGNSALGAFLFTLIFYAITIAVITYWHAVLLQAMHHAHKKSFTLLRAFKGTRTIWARTGLLWLLSTLWFTLFSLPLLYTDFLVLELISAIVLLLTPYVFLRAPGLLIKQSTISALKISFQSSWSKSRVVKWASVKIVSIVALAIIIVGSWSVLAEIPLQQAIRVVISFVAVAWFAVLSPSFSFLLTVGGGNILHTISLFFVAVLLSFSYAVLLREQ